MMTSQLLFEFIGRLAPSRYPHHPEEQPDTLLRRLRSFVGRRWREHPPPPYFSEHLCRDIGIQPPPRTQEWPWPR